MARRGQRKGDWLASDMYTGMTRYASELKQDWWGVYAQKPLLRNLQEIAVGLDDPQPVPFYSGPTYEASNGCIAEDAPIFVGLTNVPTNPNNAAFIAFNLSPSIPDMIVGCSWVIR